MRALLYDRRSAADAGEPSQAGLLELRRYADLKGWTVVGAVLEEQRKPMDARPELEQLVRSAGNGEVDVVVVRHLHVLFRDAAHLVRLGEHLMQHGVALVVTQDLVDTTDTSGRMMWGQMVEWLAGFEHRRHRELTRAGIVISRMRDEGVWGRRPQVVLNPLELRELWEGGLSQQAIHARLRRGGVRVGQTTLRRWLARMVEAGDLRPEARAAALVLRPLPKGGRPRKRRA